MNIHGIQSVGTLTQQAGGFATLSGSFTGSFKGDGSQLTGLPSSSADTSGLVTTSSFNAYTASSNTSASLALVTASFDNGTRNLTFTKGDTQTFSVNIPDVSGSTGNFATTGSNTFIGDQTISGSLLISGSEVIVGELTSSRLRVNSATSLGGTLSVAFDTIMRGDLTIESTSPQIKLRDNGAGGFSAGYDVRVDTGSFEIYDDTHNRDVLSDFFNSSSQQHTTSLTSEIIVISGSTSVTLIGNVSASIISASTINGLGDPLVFSTSVDSRLDSLEGASGSFTTTSSFNAYTSSNDQKVNSLIAATGSYATTGSNVFVGNQTISGSLIQSSSNSLNVDPLGQGVGTWIRNRVNISDVPGGPAPRLFISGSDGAFTEFGRGFINQDTTKVTGLGASIYTGADVTTAALNTVAVYNSDFSTDVELQMFANSSGVGLSDWDNGSAFNYVPFMTLTPNTGNNPSPVFTRGLQVTGSTEVGTFTASLQQGFVFVGNASGRTTTVATSSFGGGSGAGFPFTGSAQITGSLGITGSLSGLVNTLTISSNTASLDFNNGNFFTLQLVSGSITHLTATNIKPGQTINLLVRTDSGSAAATGSLTFSSAFKFAGGFDYTPTAITASQDLVSFVTFDTTQVLASQVKNLS